MSYSPTQKRTNWDSGTHTDAETLALQFEDKQLKCISCCLSASVFVTEGGVALYMLYVYSMYIEASPWATAPPIHTQLRAKNFN